MLVRVRVSGLSRVSVRVLVMVRVSFIFRTRFTVIVVQHQTVISHAFHA